MDVLGLRGTSKAIHFLLEFETLFFAKGKRREKEQEIVLVEEAESHSHSCRCLEMCNFLSKSP